MKTLIIADVPNWAIGKLSKSIKNNSSLQSNVEIIYVHPRDAEMPEEIQKVKDHLNEFNPDVVHFQYWNTAQKLIKQIPELRKIKTVLTHHNQKNTCSEDWNSLDINFHIVHTKKNRQKLLDAGYPSEKIQIIQHGIDLSYFEFNSELPTSDEMFGYVGRVCPWKGMKEILQASCEIGYPLLFMGKPDKIDYWNSIPERDKSNLYTQFMNCKDSERIEAYRMMNVYVGNSNDGREEGTLGLLEAMACGVPVVTTPSGEAADICEHEVNALIVPFGDYNALKEAMNRLMNDKDLAEKLRQKAWDTVKNLSDKKMALEYHRMYKKLYYNDVLVTVIIPTIYKNEKRNDRIIDAYQKQTYNSIECSVLFDDNSSLYGLARLRNEGAIYADGELLIFNDDRILPDENAVELFVERYKKRKDEKVWFFGNKDNANKKSFVENFSAISRENYIKAGMCCERMTRYGGMSQELRERFMSQGFEFEFCPDIHAKAMCKSSKTNERRQDIIESKFKLFKMGL